MNANQSITTKGLKAILIFTFLLISVLTVQAKSSDRGIAISRAKALFIATANGDVAKIKQLTTPEFYREKYPYSDARVRQMLLNVPADKRKNMIYQIQNQTTATASMNRAGDVITVTLTNKVTRKEFTVQMIDERGNGDWRVFDYWK